MEQPSNPREKQQMILAGACPDNHESEDRVCRACYEELLKQYNKLKNQNTKTKSPWYTW